MNNSNEKTLHLKFVKLGSDRRRLTNELLVLLPEIYERGIYKKYAATIIEYAGKFGGLSKGVVLKRLRLEKHLQNKPLLQEAVRTQGVHKVALIAALATPETEKVWVDKLENMSKSALQELSKEVRSKDSGGAAPCKAVPIKITLELDEESSFLFLSLKKKFGNNLSNKEVMKKILEMANTHERSECASFSRPHQGGLRSISHSLPSVKVIPGDNFTDKTEQESDYANRQKGNRYIPIQLKRVALANTNNHCSYPSCNRPPEIFHHTERFSLNQNHKSITPLCKIHHEFAHNRHNQDWQMQLDIGSSSQPEQQIDSLYRWRRRLAIAKCG